MTRPTRDGLSLAPLETSRLRLRPLRESDEDAIIEVFADDEAMNWHHAKWNRENVRYVLGLRLEHYQKFGFGVMAVVDKATDRLVGQAGLQYMDLSRVEYVIYIARRLWRQKYALEASQAVLDASLGNEVLTEVYAATRHDNTSVHGLLKSLTFERVGEIVHYDLDALLWRTTSSRWMASGASPK